MVGAVRSPGYWGQDGEQLAFGAAPVCHASFVRGCWVRLWWFLMWPGLRR